MDDFIKSLSLTANSTVSDVVLPCAKILLRLLIVSETSLSYIHIEMLLKAALFIDECMTMFGVNNLKEALFEQYPFYEAYFENFFLNKLKGTNCVSFVINQILKIKGGLDNIFLLDRILKTFNESTKKHFSVMSNVETTFSKDNTTNFIVLSEREKILQIVDRIFQLPVQKIDEAIERFLQEIPFELVGLIFVEPKSSIFYDKCTILEQKICIRLMDEKVGVPPYFLHTLYKTAATSDDGLKFYWQCLKSKAFCDSLCQMFLLYLKNLIEIGENEFESRHVIYGNYSLDAMLFLINSTLAMNSTIREKVYRQFYSTNIRENLINLINSMNFIYE